MSCCQRVLINEDERSDDKVDMTKRGETVIELQPCACEPDSECNYCFFLAGPLQGGVSRQARLCHNIWIFRCEEGLHETKTFVFIFSACGTF